MNKNLIGLATLIDEISMGPFGSDIKVENFVSFGIPVLNGSNLTSIKLVEDQFKYVTPEKAATFNKAIAKRGDIVVTHRGTLGQISFIPDDSKFPEYVISQSQFRVRLKLDLVNPAFFVYYFHTKEGQKRLLANKCHVGVPALAQATTNFKLIKIPLPSISEQQKIAAVLYSLDSKIELNNRINAELEAMAKSLYDYWFVQFDFPNRDGRPYKTSGGKMVFNDELKREIPYGWDVKRLGKTLETSLGGTPSTENKNYWENGTINWLNSGEVANFPIIDSELKITVLAIRNSATSLLPKGTTLLSITRHLRPTVLGIDACANQSVVGIKEKSDLKYYFIYPYLKNEIPRLMGLRTGAQQPHINKDIVDNSLIVIPNEASNILKLYNSKVGIVYEQIMNNAFQNKQLAELRDWLLPMLMNGQVVVNDER